MCLITVFTPTYNRKSFLPNLHHSLCSQTFKNFEWLIIDDGSTDGTELLIQEFQNSKIIDIRYYKQPNGGKHRAFNVAVDMARGEIFSIVDSDDTLFDNALNVLWNEYQKVKSDKLICRISNPRMFKSQPIYDGKSSDLYYGEFVSKYSDILEYWDSFKTSILLDYKFPDIEGEKFCSEALIFTTLGCDYKVHFFFGKYYDSKYYPDGLTASSLYRRVFSINYTLLVYENSYNLRRMPLMYRLKSLVNLYFFSFFKRGKTIDYMKKYGVLSFPFMMFGFVLYMKYKIVKK